MMSTCVGLTVFLPLEVTSASFLATFPTRPESFLFIESLPDIWLIWHLLYRLSIVDLTVFVIDWLIDWNNKEIKKQSNDGRRYTFSLGTRWELCTIRSRCAGSSVPRGRQQPRAPSASVCPGCRAGEPPALAPNSRTATFPPASDTEAAGCSGNRLKPNIIVAHSPPTALPSQGGLKK